MLVQKYVQSLLLFGQHDTVVVVRKIEDLWVGVFAELFVLRRHLAANNTALLTLLNSFVDSLETVLDELVSR